MENLGRLSLNNQTGWSEIDTLKKKVNDLNGDANLKDSEQMLLRRQIFSLNQNLQSTTGRN